MAGDELKCCLSPTAASERQRNMSLYLSLILGQGSRPDMWNPRHLYQGPQILVSIFPKLQYGSRLPKGTFLGFSLRRASLDPERLHLQQSLPARVVRILYSGHWTTCREVRWDPRCILNCWGLWVSSVAGWTYRLPCEAQCKVRIWGFPVQEFGKISGRWQQSMKQSLGLFLSLEAVQLHRPPVHEANDCSLLLCWRIALSSRREANPASPSLPNRSSLIFEEMLDSYLKTHLQ
jgi:hypothetical protein